MAYSADDAKEFEDVALDEVPRQWVYVPSPTRREEHLKRDILDASKASYFWRKVGNGSEAAAKVLVVTQGLLSFGAATFNLPLLSFASGGMTVLAVGLYGFSTYIMAENKQRTEQMNILLKVSAPDITVRGVSKK